MKNTVLVESKTRQRLKMACALMCVFCLCFIAVLVCVVMIGSQTLNGQTDEITGVLNEVYVDDTNTVIIDKDKHFNVVWDDEEYGIKLADFIGKTVTLTVTHDTFSASNPWALGLSADGQTIVDFKTTLDKKTAENNEIKTVVIIVTAILCVATCGLFIWRFNIAPLAERELYGEFAEYLSARQPTCKQRKWMIAYVAVYFALVVALLITTVLIDPNAETIPELVPAAKAVLWTMLAVTVVGGIGIFVFREWITYKEIDFYAEKLPFDFTDISHAPLRKTVKEQLQQEILKEHNEHPHTYADGGNGYDATFGENGVTLSIPLDDWDPDMQPHNNVEMPDANAVFCDTAATENTVAAEQNRVPENRVVMTLSYDELNFEAVAHFRKGARPMMIVIKSRLERKESFPEEFVNDLHFAFDSNLQNTLNLFNAKVDNLEELLNNKKQLMLENCLTFRKKNAKTTK